MALSEARRAALMTYCRIVELAPGEGELLELLYTAAVSYLEQAGVSQPAPDTPRAAQYDLAVNYLVLDAFDRREVISTVGAAADNPSLRRLINQMKLTEPPVSNLDTGV